MKKRKWVYIHTAIKQRDPENFWTTGFVRGTQHFF